MLTGEAAYIQRKEITILSLVGRWFVSECKQVAPLIHQFQLLTLTQARYQIRYIRYLVLRERLPTL
jgi:hypothetical protein